MANKQQPHKASSGITKVTSEALRDHNAQAASSHTREGEALTSLMESSIRETIARRSTQAEFLARGLRAGRDAQQSGIYFAAEAVHDDLAQGLEARRKQVLG